jgi:ABC-type Fe3+ transport system permease subunit
VVREHPWSTVAAFFVLLLGCAPALAGMGRATTDPGVAWRALLDPVLWERLLTRIGLSLSVLSVSIPLGLVQAWLLVRSNLGFRTLLFALLPLPLFLPPLLHILTWFGAFRVTGIPALLLLEIIMATPLIVLGAARSLEAVSRSHTEVTALIGGSRAVLKSDLRLGLPGALVGAALALSFQLSDFTLADFLSAVGPKVTVYGDSLYAHHLALRPAATAGAAVPGLVIVALLLAYALRKRRQIGASLDSSFEPAPPLSLGRFRWPLTAGMLVLIGVGAVFPFVSLAAQAGSIQTVIDQATAYLPQIRFTVFAAASAAGFTLLLAFPLALAARGRKSERLLDLLVPLPFAVPALIHGTGMIAIFNRPGLTALYLWPGLLVFALATRYLVFSWLPLQSSVQRIAPSLLEMPRLTGASSWLTTRAILVPLLLRTMVSSCCIAFAFSLREIDSVMVLRAGQDTLLHAVYSNVIFARESDLAALALILATLTGTPLLLHQLLLGRAMRFL